MYEDSYLQVEYEVGESSHHKALHARSDHLATPTELLSRIAKRCPKLGGNTLPTPVLSSKTASWQRFQKFSMKADDPYGMKESPPVAPFLKDPNSWGRAPRKCELHGGPGRYTL